MAKRIIIDISDETSVAVCSCGWRGSITFTPKTAYKQALDHAHNVHLGDPAWQNAMHVWRCRHADLLSE